MNAIERFSRKITVEGISYPLSHRNLAKKKLIFAMRVNNGKDAIHKACTIYNTNNRCAIHLYLLYCRAEGITFDITPELDINNLQVLCKNCNMEKSNKNDYDYRKESDLLKLLTRKAI